MWHKNDTIKQARTAKDFIVLEMLPNDDTDDKEDGDNATPPTFSPPGSCFRLFAKVKYVASPAVRSTAVVAINVDSIIEFRSVCTANTFFL